MSILNKIHRDGTPADLQIGSFWFHKILIASLSDLSTWTESKTPDNVIELAHAIMYGGPVKSEIDVAAAHQFAIDHKFPAMVNLTQVCKSKSCCAHPPFCTPRRPLGVPLTHIGYVTCDECCEHFKNPHVDF